VLEVKRQESWGTSGTGRKNKRKNSAKFWITGYFEGSGGRDGSMSTGNRWGVLAGRGQVFRVKRYAGPDMV